MQCMLNSEDYSRCFLSRTLTSCYTRTTTATISTSTCMLRQSSAKLAATWSGWWFGSSPAIIGDMPSTAAHLWQSRRWQQRLRTLTTRFGGVGTTGSRKAACHSGIGTPNYSGPPSPPELNPWLRRLRRTILAAYCRGSAVAVRNRSTSNWYPLHSLATKLLAERGLLMHLVTRRRELFSCPDLT